MNRTSHEAIRDPKRRDPAGHVFHWTEKFIAQTIDEAKSRGIRPEALFAEMRRQGKLAMLSESAKIGPTISVPVPPARKAASVTDDDRSPDGPRPRGRKNRKEKGLFGAFAGWFGRGF